MSRPCRLQALAEVFVCKERVNELLSVAWNLKSQVKFKCVRITKYELSKQIGQLDI